jgi:hypothetical protein
LGGTRAKLAARGVETLAVIEDRVEPARRYFRLRPPRVPVAGDPERRVHLAYGLPRPLYAAPDFKHVRDTTLINPTGEAPEPMVTVAINKFLNDRDHLGDIAEAKAVLDQFPPRDFNIFAGHFLIGRTGVVRQTWVEGPPDHYTRWGIFPSEQEILKAIDAPDVA